MPIAIFLAVLIMRQGLKTADGDDENFYPDPQGRRD